MDCLNYFKARVPTDQELATLKPHVLTQDVIQWNPRSSQFSAPVDPSLENLINAANDAISTVLQDRHLNMHAVAEADTLTSSGELSNNNRCSQMVPLEENTQEQGEIIPFPESVHSFNPSEQHSSDLELVENPSTPMSVDPDDIVPVESNLTMSTGSQE